MIITLLLNVDIDAYNSYIIHGVLIMFRSIKKNVGELSHYKTLYQVVAAMCSLVSFR